MPGNFLSPDGDLEQQFVTDTETIDQFAKTGTLWLWGNNTYGQLADNTVAIRRSPIQTIAGGINWKRVIVDIDSSIAIKTDGTLWTWGHNAYGNLGNNTVGSPNNSSNSVSSPVQTIAGGTNWKYVAGRNYAVAAIKTDNTLWTWGYNYNYVLGDGTSTSRASPVQTLIGGTNWKQVSVGGTGFMSAVKTDGTLWTWGFNNYGQLGNGLVDTGGLWQNDASSPIQTIAGGTNWKQVTCGAGHVAAVKTDGSLWLWGFNLYGELGNGNNGYPAGTTNSRSSPVQTAAGGTNWREVSAGGTNTAAIKTDGTLWVWGTNNGGNLANGTAASPSWNNSPNQTISGGTDWKQAACGGSHMSAIKTNGTLWSWGQGLYGNLGDNATPAKSSPVQTTAGGNNWKQVSAGTTGSAAIYFYDAGNLYPSP
jgi:alpha-tubulin suppressor-like RCC1 family protein